MHNIYCVFTVLTLKVKNLQSFNKHNVNISFTVQYFQPDDFSVFEIQSYNFPIIIYIYICKLIKLFLLLLLDNLDNSY